jgi:gliding motility-associated-like protein
LPSILDSFLVIDGTTQPGNSPMSGQIIIDGSALPPGPSHGLVVYTRRTEIYGLQIQNFPGDGIQLFGGFIDDAYLSNIIIGAPNKGNVIIGNGSYGIEGPVNRNVLVQGNYIGTDVSFNAGLGNGWDGILLSVLEGANVRVGGSRTLAQQNVLCSNQFSALRVSIDDPVQYMGGIRISGNIIGTDITGSIDLGNAGMTFGPGLAGGGISVLGDGPVQIGGAGPLANIIAFNYDGVYTDTYDRKTILENSFYCNSNRGVRLDNNANNGILPPAILCLQGNNLVGTAFPGAMIDVYLHDDAACNGVPCQGRTLLNSIVADGAGNWMFNISAWPGSRFTANSHDLNGNSSDFAECILDPNVIASNGGPYCPGDSIFLFATLDTMVGNVTFEWFGPNGYGSTQQNPVDAVDPGTYLVVADIEGCGADSAYTEVMVYPLATDTIRDICIGDSIIVNGTVYGFGNTFGQELFSGASQYGCDSLVVIDLVFMNSIAGRIFSTRPTACIGDTVGFWFDLQFGNGPHDVVFSTGPGQVDTIFGIYDGQYDSVIVAGDVYFEILDIISAETTCPPDIRPSDSIRVSTLNISPVVTDYNGYGVSCFGENDGMITLNVTGAVGLIDYDWNLAFFNGDMASQLTAGAYSVTVTDIAGCSLVFDTLITQPPRFEAAIFIEPTTCFGVNDGVIVIDAILGARGPVEYALNGGAFSPVDSVPFMITGLNAGAVDLTLVDSAGCVQDLPLFVPLGETPFLDLGGVQSIFSGDSVLLNFNTSLTPDLISWSPVSMVSCASCPSTYAFPPVDQYITLTLTDTAGCVATDSVLIRVFVPKRVYIPTVFSPNGDQINDVFYIQAGEFAVSIDYLLVVDRWGNAVYELSDFPANDPDFGWDGTLNGREMFPAVFTYLTHIRFTDGEVLPFSGTVTLIR